MNEFLKKLRSNDKRYDKNRRPYGNPQYRGADKHDGNTWKGGATTNVTIDAEKLAAVLGDHLPEIKSLLEGISKSQTRAAEAMERRSAAEERKAGAMEVIAEHLSQMLENRAAPVLGEGLAGGRAPQRIEDVEPPESGASKKFNRDEIIRLIFKMRDKGSTYGEIAEYLESKKIPTFSGKGAWHAQTVHRFYARQ